jgi:hypothetical protein
MSANQRHHADNRRLSTTGNRCPYTGPMTELGSPVRSQVSVEEIAKAIALSWQEDGKTTVEMVTPNAVYLYERKLVEWVFGDAKSAAEFSDTFAQIRKRGIEVAIILPMPELGFAHEEFWGTGLNLYGWVDRGDNVIRFIGPEVA